MKKLLVFLLGLISIVTQITAQQDTIKLINEEVLTGELKSATFKSIVFDSDYIKEKVTINMENVSSLKTINQFKLIDDKGNIHVGKIEIKRYDTKYIYLHLPDSILSFPKEQVFTISSFSSSFEDNFDISADVGYDHAKQRNTSLLNLGTKVGYRAKRWELGIEYSSYTTRTDTILYGKNQLDLGVNYLMPRNWLLNFSTIYMNSDEQQIDFRSTNILGIGKYLYYKNNDYLLLIAGGAGNFERFSTSDELFKSAEIHGMLNIKLTLLKDLNFTSSLVVIPSLNEENRVRSLIHAELKYDINKHFKLNIKYDFNKDSNPPVATNKTDYHFTLGLGWEL